MSSDDPAYLAVGTAVSAKYKGAFCESIIKKIDKNVKCKVTYKEDNKMAVVSDHDIKGLLKVGSIVEVRKGDIFVEAIVNRITDHSIYHVLFDDGDENSLKRSKLCPKGDRHFTKSTTLDGLPLTHPEDFCTPVIKRENLKKTLVTQNQCSDSEESDMEPNVQSDLETADSNEDLFLDRRQDLMGRIVYLTNPDVSRKNQATPATMMVPPLLVVLPGADGNAPSNSKILTKSFKDSRFMSQSINSLKCLTAEDLPKLKCPKIALDRASLYLSKQELPSSWDRSELLGFSSDDDEDDELDDDEIDNYDKKKSSEMRDRFVAEYYRFMEERGSPINCVPTISHMELDLYKLFHIVQHLGGNNKVTNSAKWHIVHKKMNFDYSITLPSEVKAVYKKYLHAFEDLDRKLGRFRSSWSSKVTVGSRSIVSFRDRDHELSTLVKNNRMKRKKEQSNKIGTEPSGDFQDQPNDPSKILKIDDKCILSDDESTNEDVCKEIHQTKSKREPLESQRKQKPQDSQLASLKNKKSIPKDLLKNNRIHEKLKQTTKDLISKVKNKSVSDIKIKRIELKMVKNLPLYKSENRDGRYKEKKLDEKLKDGGLKDVMIESLSSKDGDEDNEMQIKGKDELLAASKTDITDKTCRRTLRRGNNENSGETKEEITKKGNVNSFYAIGTRLKVRYGDGKNTKIYGAKILEMKERNDSFVYLVHYNGWNSRYDDWITADQIVEVLGESIGDDPIPNMPHKLKRSNILQRGNRLNRYHRLSSSDTTTTNKDDLDASEKKKRLPSSPEITSDSESNNGSDMNSENKNFMADIPLISHPDEKGDNVKQILMDCKSDDNYIKNNEEINTETDLDIKLKDVSTKYEELPNLFSLADAASESLGLEESKHSPTFSKSFFQISAFSRKSCQETVHKNTIAENRSVWKDDGRLNLNLVESPLKTSPHSFTNSPIFDALTKKQDEFLFETREEDALEIKGEEEEEDNEECEYTIQDKNSSIDTASSEGGGVEENASTRSDLEANREVEAYMTSDYTILDRKVDYVMLNRLPGDAVSYYVPSLDDSSDTSSNGRIACPKPIQPYIAVTIKEESIRKRRKDGKAENDASDSEIDSQKIKLFKSNCTPMKIHSMENNNSTKHEHEHPSKKRSYNSTTRSLSKYTNLNFVDLDALKDLKGEERIDFIMGKIHDLRLVYLELKADLACIDRRRRKHRDKIKDASIFTCSEIK